MEMSLSPVTPPVQQTDKTWCANLALNEIERTFQKTPPRKRRRRDAALAQRCYVKLSTYFWFRVTTRSPRANPQCKFNVYVCMVISMKPCTAFLDGIIGNTIVSMGNGGTEMRFEDVRRKNIRIYIDYGLSWIILYMSMDYMCLFDGFWRLYENNFAL